MEKTGEFWWQNLLRDCQIVQAGIIWFICFRDSIDELIGHSIFFNCGICLVLLSLVFVIFKPSFCCCYCCWFGGIRKYSCMYHILLCLFFREIQKINLSLEYFPTVWTISREWLWWNSYHLRLCCQGRQPFYLLAAGPNSFPCLCPKPLIHPWLLSSLTSHPVYLAIPLSLLFI